MKNLQNSDLLLIFTYAPAGLGHLRVTDALADGLPRGIDSILLGADDTNITYWHRLTSLSPFFRGVVEWFTTEENGYWFYAFYIWLLKISSAKLYFQLKKLITGKYPDKKTVVVISTHFGLAHQISAIKDRLEQNLRIKLILVVQVTDATSIEIWYVPGADLIVVPSEKVKTELLKYAKDKAFEKTKIMVLPYPLSQTLGYQLSDRELEFRLKQYDRNSNVKIKIVIPISGAAVGLAYYDKLILKLGKICERFMIYLVVRNDVHTRAFIRKMKTRHYLTVIENRTDIKVVDSYEKLYGSEVIALEIVKPSEQAFKTLFTPKQRGGSILLLNKAVGRQEQDNLNFLLDHQLLPNRTDQNKLQKYAFESRQPDETDCRKCINRAQNWRAIKLTNDPDKDAHIINWCLQVGLFGKMSEHETKLKQKDPELASNGVQQFWEKVDDLVEDTR